MSAESNQHLDSETIAFMDACLQKEHPKSYLIAVLHKIQQRYGYLSQAHMDQVAQHMQIPTSIISGVSTFYHFFRLQPRGKFSISICLGTACFVKGADKVLDAFRTELGIELGETTPDGLFSLESSRCLGVCALAPVVTINDKIYSKVTAKQVPELLNSVKAAAID
ncbi:MAG TPA: NADH-quinone oxidoreductase subunit NuoE [bacterium]|jgi:NADH:ubiquinone oxidoreductase subunit E|nr:NADH-quinone oxidoreductase subunit NuoE [bacterium]HNT64172.1 NADH-quinone oxidoreductase subunit NuoE [bacterium]HOX87494.1 NADH-quinone oxidoreductase subunit NuoE [bacterium]HPG47209.1 NADH-quinone oxidoreductase subunit NuoE [bacterium]HPM99451.1 NADH-quinone oxidoreductase subunit NuoE [bacterium]